VQDEESQICGLVAIDNYDGFTLAHARHFDQKATKIFTSVIQVLALMLWNSIGKKHKTGYG